MGLEERCGYRRRGKIDGLRWGNDRLKRAVGERKGRGGTRHGQRMENEAGEKRKDISRGR